jgi:hypothetical protein
MRFGELIVRITPYPTLSILVWVAALLLVLYLERKFFHRTIRALTRLIHNALRLTAASVRTAQRQLAKRNRDVLIQRGLEQAERKAEREFHHISAAVVGNLKSYAALHNQLSGMITKLEDDHRGSMDVPPSLPNWAPIIEAVAKIEHPGDALVARTLSEINRTLTEQYGAATETYRGATKNRHAILNNMLPLWHKLQKTLQEVEKSVTALTHRAKRIDRHIDDYKAIHAQTDKAVRAAGLSSLTQFFISGVFLLCAVGAAVINIYLIALPMAEILGGGSYLGPFKTAEVAAAVITAVEVTLGFFLVESLRITRVFPIISSLGDNKRQRLMWVSLALLVVFAGVEASLAVLRDAMAADMESLRQTLTGAVEFVSANRLIPAACQMIIGFVMPFCLAAGAIPLASFAASARTMAGIAAAASLGAIAFLLRLLGHLAVYAGKLVSAVYDLVIFPTLWLETALNNAQAKGKTPSKRKKKFGFLSHTEDASPGENPSLELKEERK